MAYVLGAALLDLSLSNIIPRVDLGLVSDLRHWISRFSHLALFCIASKKQVTQRGFL